MERARYHRDRAERCLEMAGHMSDRQAAEVLRAASARHFAQALELEKQARTVSDPTADMKL
jgi:hypothetical protein